MKKLTEQKTDEGETKPKRKRMRSFEADPDVAQMLDAAADSGAVITDIANEALRKHGPEILRDYAKKLREKAESIEKSISVCKR